VRRASSTLLSLGEGKVTFQEYVGLPAFLKSFLEGNLLTPDGIESVRVERVEEEMGKGGGVCLGGAMGIHS